MKLFLVISLVVLQLWTATAAPRAKASAATPTEAALPNIEELVSQAQNSFKTVSSHLNEMLGLPKDADAGDVLEVVKKNTDSWAKELTEFSEKIKKQVDTAKTGELSETVKSIQEKIGKTIESLKKEVDSPEVKSKTKQLQDNFTNSLKVIVEEANKLSKTVTQDKSINEDLQKLSKQVVDQAVKAADQLQQSVHDVTGHAKEHADHKH